MAPQFVDIVALLIAIGSIVVAFLALYFAKLRGPKIELAPVSDLAIWLVRGNGPSEVRPGLVVFLSMFNLGSKPAWIQDISVSIGRRGKSVRMPCAGWFPLEKFSHRVPVDDFQFANYPLAVGRESQLSIAPMFLARDKADDLAPDKNYSVTVDVQQADRKISRHFALKIAGEAIAGKGPDFVLRFAPVGIERGYPPLLPREKKAEE